MGNFKGLSWYITYKNAINVMLNLLEENNVSPKQGSFGKLERLCHYMQRGLSYFALFASVSVSRAIF